MGSPADHNENQNDSDSCHNDSSSDGNCKAHALIPPVA